VGFEGVCVSVFGWCACVVCGEWCVCVWSVCGVCLLCVYMCAYL